MLLVVLCTTSERFSPFNVYVAFICTSRLTKFSLPLFLLFLFFKFMFDDAKYDYIIYFNLGLMYYK